MLFKLPRFTTIFLFPIVSGCGFVYLLSILEGNWLCDLCAEARLAMLAPISFVLIFALLRNNAAMAFCSTVLVSIIIMQTIFSTGHALDKKLDLEIKVDPAKQISILNFNTEFQHNDKVGSLISFCKKVNPDIVVLTESSKDFVNAMEELEYPSVMSVLKSPGISVFSKYPFKGSQIYYPSKSKHPQVHFQIEKNNKIINIAAIHFSARQTLDGYNERKNELEALKSQLKKMPYSTIVAGDTNCSNWSSSIRSFLKNTDLKDSQEGFMTLPTWPARTGKVIPSFFIPPFVAIDNVFLTKDFCVLERRVGPALGSDHMPIFTKLQLSDKTR